MSQGPRPVLPLDYKPVRNRRRIPDWLIVLIVLALMFVPIIALALVSMHP